MKNTRSPRSFGLRMTLWKVIREIESEPVGHSPGKELHRLRVVHGAARVFSQVSKEGRGENWYARFMGISRPELIRWLLLCKSRYDEALKKKEVHDKEWDSLSAERSLEMWERGIEVDMATRHHSRRDQRVQSKRRP